MRLPERFREGTPGNNAPQLNAMLDEIKRLGKLYAVTPLQIRTDATGIQLSMAGSASGAPVIWARLSATTSAYDAKYSWYQVDPGTWTATSGGLTGVAGATSGYAIESSGFRFIPTPSDPVALQDTGDGNYAFSWHNLVIKGLLITSQLLVASGGTINVYVNSAVSGQTESIVNYTTGLAYNAGKILICTKVDGQWEITSTACGAS